MSRAYAHEPVMAREVVDLLTGVPPGIVVDATVGGGGHARLVLEARDDLSVLGLDRDPRAIEAAGESLAGFGDRVHLVHAGFADVRTVLAAVTDTGGMAMQHQNDRTDAAHTDPGDEGGHAVAYLFDLGVSSHQLDEPARGFSYRHDGPLDMRMDTGQERSAADVVNGAEEAEVVSLLQRFGEERFARPIARSIVARRPIRTTYQLSDAVAAALPARARRRRGHPARRTFQAIRIAVNDELGQLEHGLDGAVADVVPGGRIVALSYHSLEDRIVKRRFREWATGGAHPPGLPTSQTDRGGVVDLLTRRPLRPSPDEVAANPRAESARLRAVERLPVRSSPAGPADHGPAGGAAA